MVYRKLGIKDILLIRLNQQDGRGKISLETCSDRLVMSHGPGKKLVLDYKSVNGDNTKGILEAEERGMDVLAPRKLLGYIIKCGGKYTYYSTGQRLSDSVLDSDSRVAYRVERADVDWLGNPK